MIFIQFVGLNVPDTAFSLAIEPEKSSQYDSLIKALSILVLEDPSLRYEINEESGQLLIHGIGELHLEIVCDKLNRQFDVPVEVGEMFVAYRESIGVDEKVDKKTFILDKVMGGKRFFAEITGSVWQDSVKTTPTILVDEDVRKSLRNDEYFALTDGLQKSFMMGPAGYPLVGITVQISSLTFDTATNLGSIRSGVASFVESVLASTDNIVLEPYMLLQVDLPAPYVGDVLSDLTVSRRATIQDVVNSNGDFSTIYGQVPLATMLGYASTVRSLTQGQGMFSMEYYNHQPVA
jgi:elongation factor G